MLSDNELQPFMRIGVSKILFLKGPKQLENLLLNEYCIYICGAAPGFPVSANELKVRKCKKKNSKHIFKLIT